jgi:hypothetical protein
MILGVYIVPKYFIGMNVFLFKNKFGYIIFFIKYIIIKWIKKNVV